ncbi:MAG: glycoside hydrolase family 3 C-terminal domain-containing protein [Lachnospiraceae bacterium]|nr:glycoside hydrolase family 3 C-terminal domain-containing protein [Lachnospiraceae bacterium]
MKKKKVQMSIVCMVLLSAVYATPVHAAALDVQVSDVITVLKNCIPYFAAIGVILIAAIVFAVYCRKFEKPKKKFCRLQTLLASILALTTVLNLVCLGPVSTLLDVVVQEKAEVSEESVAEAKELITDIAEEGIVMVKNDGTLPLSDSTNKLNVFGWASTNPCYGGTGSGAVDTTNCVTLLDGLKAGGYEVNQTLVDMYTSYAAARPESGMMAVDWTLPEPTTDYYTDEIMNEAREFSDVAVIVIARVGGEGTDLPTDFGARNEDGSNFYTYTNNSTEYDDFTDGQTYLELSQTEKKMVDLVCENFDNVIVIYNSANAMELGWVEEYDSINAVLCCPGAGETGFAALGSILNGDVNPSGKLADTYVYDLTATPYFNNFGDFTYDNMDEFAWEEMGEKRDVNFVEYSEGIYVGYKFYETAYAEAEAGNMDYDYESMVQYPFGYGLSYTTFAQKISSFEETEDGFTMTVTVTNTGDTAGKDVVELYYNPPYTNGGIEKAAVNLIDFAKTESLEPGASETVEFTVSAEDMASFDTYGEGCYVLEAGEYEISIRSDAHTVLDNCTYTVDDTIVYDEANPRSSDETAATVQFADAEGDDVEYLSRADGFANYAAATAAPDNYSMSEERKANYQNASNYDIESMNDTSDVMPTTGASNGLVLADLRGLDFDDPKWDELLDEMSVKDMSALISGGGYQTAAVDSIEKVATTDNDGPATIYNNYTGATGNAYPSEVMLANTWNKDLAKAMGESIGKEADELDVSGWYAPGMNLHRSAFGGRNFEYYSEDSILSGYMAAAEIQGANEYGVYSYIKHFALNDQETNRIYQMCTWANEQTIREIYLKAFEIAIKDGNSGAVMIGHNYIGDKWTGANYALCTTVLRDEWGFDGMVSTDMFCGYGYYDADIAIRSGVDSMLNPMGFEDANVTDTTSATSVTAMRNSCHHILYTVVNSRAYSDENTVYHMVLWKQIMIGVDVAIAILLILLEVLILRRYKKENK